MDPLDSVAGERAAAWRRRFERTDRLQAHVLLIEALHSQGRFVESLNRLDDLHDLDNDVPLACLRLTALHNVTRSEEAVAFTGRRPD